MLADKHNAIKQIHAAHDIDLSKYFNVNAKDDKDMSHLVTQDIDKCIKMIKRTSNEPIEVDDNYAIIS